MEAYRPRLRPDYVQQELETRISEADSSDEDELPNRQSSGQATTADEVDTQDTAPAGIRVSSRSTKGKKPDRYVINEKENNEDDMQ